MKAMLRRWILAVEVAWTDLKKQNLKVSKFGRQIKTPEISVLWWEGQPVLWLEYVAYCYCNNTAGNNTVSDFPLELKAGKMSKCKWMWLLLVAGVHRGQGNLLCTRYGSWRLALCRLPYLVSSSKIKGWCQVAKIPIVYFGKLKHSAERLK